MGWDNLDEQFEAALERENEKDEQLGLGPFRDGGSKEADQGSTAGSGE